MIEQSKIKSYRDLLVWQKAHELALFIYKITDTFPKNELFGITSQMRRASVSITSNLAEGYGRFTQKDREHFYVMAQGSIYELDNQCQLAYDLGFIDFDSYQTISVLTLDVIKLLAGLLKVHRTKL